MTDLTALAADIPWPDHGASTRAHDSISTDPALGALGVLAEWICGMQGEFPPRPISRARLIIFAADHGVAVAGVSAYPAGRTARVIADIGDGNDIVNVLADLAGAGVRVVEMDAGSARIDVEPALSGDQVAAAISTGAAIADEEIDAGADLLIAGNLGTGSTTTAATLISVLTSTEPAKAVGRGGSAIDDSQWMHKVTAIRDARLRGWPHRYDPSQLLAACGSADVAALTGFLMRAASRRSPVLLDGAVVTAAAVLAAIEQPRAARWWQAAQRTGEPAQTLGLARLDLTPILDLGMTVGDGSGGLLALTLLRAAIGAIGPRAKRPAPPDVS